MAKEDSPSTGWPERRYAPAKPGRRPGLWRRGPMDVARRDLVVAGAMTLGASGLLLSGSASAQAGDEAAVTAAVETLREGLLKADKAKLAQVTAEQLSYGHSSARLETKDQFITAVMNR